MDLYIVVVSHKPMSKLSFSLFRAEASGVVICMPLRVFMEHFYILIYNSLTLSIGEVVKHIFAFNKH